MDGNTAMKMLMTTNEKPYQFSLYLPALLNKIYSDMDEYKMTVEHNPGQLLNIQTNGKKFKGLKIAKTGSGNERSIEINGKQLASSTCCCSSVRIRREEKYQRTETWRASK